MEHTHSRGMVAEFDHPVCGKIKTLGSPFHLNYSDGSRYENPYTPPPVVGQHSRSILSILLGYDEQQIATLIENNVIRGF